MANHLTPEELSKELDMDRDAIVKLCIEEGVPIYQARSTSICSRRSCRLQACHGSARLIQPRFV